MTEAFGQSGRIRSPIQPVSRIWFELSDTDAFERCIELVVQWMAQTPKGAAQPRSGVSLPADAQRGEPFDVADELGANPARAVRLQAADGALWAGRLDFPDPSAPRTWVSEFFAEKRIGSMARFGAQLTCVRRAECAPFEATRPSVIQRVLESLSAEADGRVLADKVEPTERGGAEELAALLYDEERRLPVVVLSEGDDGTTQLPPDLLARRIAGAAHIVHLTHEATWELTRLIGKRMSVFNGAVRLYQPGLSEMDEDPFAHPLWLRHALAENLLFRQLAGRALSAAFLDRSEGAFPRYAAVREASMRLSHQSGARGSDPSREGMDAALRQAVEAAEERDEWHSLALEEQERRIDAEKDVERLKLEIARLEAKSEALEYNLSQQQGAPIAPTPLRHLESYDDLEDWAEEVLGDAVSIHRAALKDCRKNGDAAMLSRIEDALLIMRDHMTPAHRAGDAGAREVARLKLAELGMDDTACFADREEAKRWSQYSVPYDDGTRVLYDHLRYGNGYNNANQIRIYYFWDEERERFVIGKMPSHLRNNLTN
ncbi:MAG: hypothetical protein WA840_05380 [Caulobacteraceae bacterium]